MAIEAAGVRVFQLVRDVDVTGFSGVGVVADGVVWPDGAVSMRWRGPLRTTVTADCIADIQTIHGHDGATRVVWADLGGAAWTAA
ncbi:hypothetical protein [Nocardia neocaledoniensis]|jgi:hypothetical protein|uniref:hypothetical protein n=1 Tax=Nocardia neocaledoniensis TaxID=236511 RepID=UPI0024583430|nr:hypothetical protein [Nocardia neocaledoniensis]